MKREAKFTSLYDLHITFTFLCYFSAMKAGFGASQLFCKKRDRDNSESLAAAKLGEMFSRRGGYC